MERQVNEALEDYAGELGISIEDLINQVQYSLDNEDFNDTEDQDEYIEPSQRVMTEEEERQLEAFERWLEEDHAFYSRQAEEARRLIQRIDVELENRDLERYETGDKALDEDEDESMSEESSDEDSDFLDDIILDGSEEI